MKVQVTPDGRFIQLVEYSQVEYEQLQSSFKKRIQAWRFHPLVKRKIWNGYISFIDRYNRLPLGLWNKLYKICQRYGFELEFDGVEYIQNTDFNQDEFRAWLKEFFKNTEYAENGSRAIREYQIQACINTLTYYKSRSEIATSAGKTMIIFIIMCYLKTKGWLKRMLIIVPNTNLIIQTYDAFHEYAQGTPLEGQFSIQMLHGGTSKDKKDVDVVIGTYQSLTKRPQEFFEDVDCVCVDEAHHTHAKSIKDIIIKAYDAKYRFGLSGTMSDDDSAESMTLDAYLGPIVNKVSAKFLIKNSFATPIFVKIILLDYLKDEIKEKLYDLRQRKNLEIDGTKLLDLERKLAIENRARFTYICDLIARTTKNSLVLFLDVKHSYGKRIYDYLRNNTNHKTVYYVDGSTPIELRNEYKAKMEEGSDKILVASTGTFSTGISINNIHHIFFVESYKSDRLVRQSIGRGMRLLKGKHKVYIWDFVDDFSYGNDKRHQKNYLLKHGEARLKIYKAQGFPYKQYKIKL